MRRVIIAHRPGSAKDDSANLQPVEGNATAISCFVHVKAVIQIMTTFI